MNLRKVGWVAGDYFRLPQSDLLLICSIYDSPRQLLVKLIEPVLRGGAWVSIGVGSWNLELLVLST